MLSQLRIVTDATAGNCGIDEGNEIHVAENVDTAGNCDIVEGGEIHVADNVDTAGNCDIVEGKLPHGSHFHDDWTKNVTSRVHVIQLTGTIFQLNSRIKKTNVLNKFHENWRKFLPTGGHVFSPIWTIFELLHEDWALNVTSTVFELDRDIIGTYLLTKFHEDRTINVASRVFTNNVDGRTTDKDRSQKLN
ncbi:hypothetical protein DPMN_071763 [Dreissena polymorpha]|uniref:Uncharacterized protein n=1 Tax=Dreissena polymorpha TaxID=45954 RepID=A0A9D4BWG1_DREPO|nr:hypothetical protein DPMN_071763 [Dreissena polymorpha]